MEQRVVTTHRCYQSQLRHLMMNKSFFKSMRNVPAQAYLAVVGGTLILISLAIDFSYANLSTYVVSYLRYKGYSTTYADWIYITVARMFFQTIMMPFMGSVARKIGSRLCILIGMIIYTLSISSTYFLIDYGYGAVVYTVSISHGIAFSLIYAQTIGCILKWFLSGNQGLMTSIAVGGYGFGSMIWIPLQTYFVNPNNIAAVPENPLDSSSDKYFENEELLENVPKLFLVMGGMIAALEIIGLMLLRTPNNEYIAESLSIKTKSSEASSGVAQERTVKQVLKMKNFWCLWTYLLTIQLGAAFFYTYQKSFGLVYINDDAFFSTIGILSNILNGSARIIWGKMYDWKGFRFNAFLVALIATASSLAINLVMYIPEDHQTGRKIFFATLSLIFYGAFPGLYTLMAPTIHGTFGHLNYARDYGLVFTQAMLGGILMILISTFLQSVLGYSGMFLLSGITGAIGLFAAWSFHETKFSS